MSKHVGPFLAFNKEWFADHQRGLLWLLNAPLIGRWFRWCMCIRSCDVGYQRDILEIRPNCYTVAGEKPNTLTTDFRAHAKYAKRLYFAFRPLWWMLHIWDFLIADPWCPQWSLGFATLTAYPDPGTGAVTVDGHVGRGAVNETFSSIQSGIGNATETTATFIGMQLEASATTDQFTAMYRGIYTFDTSAIGLGQLVDVAQLSLWGVVTENALGENDLHVAAASPAANNNLVAGDFVNISRTSFGTLAFASFSTIAYNDISLNQAGKDNISPTGISRFSSQLGWDINNSFTGTWVSLARSSLFVESADQAGTSKDPKLVITYTVPGGLVPSNKLRPNIFAPGVAR